MTIFGSNCKSTFTMDIRSYMLKRPQNDKTFCQKTDEIHFVKKNLNKYIRQRRCEKTTICKYFAEFS